MKKLHMKTYGCQMNVYDSDRMQDLMEALGYESVDEPHGADMVIINTCHIREKASEKLFSDLGRIRPHKEKKKEAGEQMIVAVAGCVAQAEGEEIFRRSNVVDIIVGPESYQTLPDLVGKVIRDKTKQINLDFVPDNKFDVLREVTEGKSAAMGVHKKSPSSFVTVQEGCDKFCTFCVVPYTRGAEYSRKVGDILDDCKRLVDQGVKEIYLLGQNVNAYHGLDDKGNSSSLAKLIEEVAKIDAVERVRYTTSHPRDMDEDLIKAHGDVEKLMPFLHLPVQAGSNNVLKMMNRKHTRQDYYKIIDKLRAARPDIGLSSDFIVGFPGETDKDFEDTLKLVEDIGFAQCYSFKYSPRPGTPAHDNVKQVEEHVKDERLQRLQKLLTEQQIIFNKKFEKQIMPVLFERKAPKSNKKQVSEKLQLWGKSPWLQSVIVDIENEADAVKLSGKIFNVEILHSRPSSLIGKLVA
ncbi:MAG: tRNA (N6-isopentenyl adenosine(37)-C2)-methylthiotransferase MiaB [Rickettsiales bacterium]|nr:tRNA (N6-isopentenyl adenosine(37)-C2)-methylthiotransferase MiaB [Rickettsiales bacterium]